MKITISEELIARTEPGPDGYLVSRIPGKQNIFLYLKKDDIISQDERTVLAEINEEKQYLVGSREGSRKVAWNAKKLLENYQYEETFDPQIRAENQRLREEKQRTRQEMQQRAVNQSKQVQLSDKQSQNVQTGGNMEDSTVKRQRQNTNQHQNEQQIQVEQQRQRTYSKEQFRQLKLGEKHHVDITKIWNIELKAEQMKQLRLMLEDGIQVDQLKYNDPSISAEVMSELRLCNRQNGEINNINWRRMNADQLKQIRLGMEHNIDIKQYAYPAYTDEQMRQLRLSLQSGFDISTYRNPHFTEKQMYSMRCEQVWQKIKDEIKSLWHTFIDHLHLDNLNRIRLNIMQHVERGLGQVADQIQNTPDIFTDRHPELVETLDDRINETVQDLKELLVAQELVSEEVMTDAVISQRFEERIRRTLDELMQPDVIQNPDMQNEIINKSAEELIQESGAELPAEAELQQLEIEEESLSVNQEAELPESNVNPVDGKTHGKGEKAEPVMNEETIDNMMSDQELMDKIGEEMRAEVAAQANVPIMQQEL